MNKCSLIGRMTKDPEVKRTQSGNSVCSFNVAVDRKYKDANGQRQTDFISCTAWRQVADIIGQYFHKGSRIGLTGSLQTRSYEDQSGRKVTVTEVLVEEIDFLEPKQKTEAVQQTQETLPIPPMPEEEVMLPFDLIGG